MEPFEETANSITSRSRVTMADPFDSALYVFPCSRSRSHSPLAALFPTQTIYIHMINANVYYISDLLRRLNPKHTTAHLNSLIHLAPDLTEDLLSSVDQPLSIRRCKQTGRDYLLCDYNRDGDSYRSPWSNEFDPPLESGAASAASLPSEKVRKMEVRANEAFDLYRDLYYEGGVSSVYFWNLDDGFAGVVLLKKGKFGL